MSERDNQDLAAQAATGDYAPRSRLTALLAPALAVVTACAGSSEAAPQASKATTGSSSDEQAITSVVNTYVHGGRLGTSAVMKQAFTPNATIYHVEASELKGGPIKVLYDAVDTAGPAPRLTSEIVAISASATTATVRLELFDWAGVRYTDHLALIKIEGEWKIVHKLYHTH